MISQVLTAVSLEEEQAKATRSKRGPVPQWQQQFVARMIEMALTQAAR